MHQNMQLVISFLKLAKQSLDFIVVGNIAHKGFRAGQRQNQVSRFLLQSLILISHCQLCAGIVQPLRDRPRNRALIGDSEHDRHTSMQIG